MSAQTILNQISNLDRELHNIEKQIHSINDGIARKRKDATGILDKINREKNLKRVIDFQKDYSRKQDEISKLEKDKSSKTKALADKHQKQAALRVILNKEEQKDREKTKREQKEILSIQQEISREVQKQKNFALDTVRNVPSIQVPKKYDVFVSHASEDKEDFVRPFALSLQSKGLKVWYDEFELSIGDSLRRSIDNGLSNSRFGIVVLSVAFFSKEWPQRELDGLFAKAGEGENIILPIWHKISKDEVKKYSPMIADLLALNTSTFTIEEISGKIAEKVLRS